MKELLELSGDGGDPKLIAAMAAMLCQSGEPDQVEAGRKLLEKGANENEPDSLYFLGSLYLPGSPIGEENYLKSRELFQRAADLGHADACAGLGELLLDPAAKMVAPELALRWLREGDQRGSALCATHIAVCYLNGTGVDSDPAEAFHWFSKGSDHGCETAKLNLGLLYFNGQGVEKDTKKAFKLFKESSELGNIDATYNLAVCYHQGLGVKQNIKKAVDSYKEAATQNHVQAQVNLGMIYQIGANGEVRVDWALEWYRKALAAGYLTAANNLGYCYLNGQGVQKDYSEAKRYFEIAIAGEQPAPAYVNLGMIYQEGEKDFAKALECYKKASDLGSPTALNNIGDCYEVGRGVVQDFAKAAEYYKKASEGGISVAMFSLGNFYRKGLGVEKDAREAEKWYQMAVAHGLEQAESALEELYEEEGIQPMEPEVDLEGLEKFFAETQTELDSIDEQEEADSQLKDEQEGSGEIVSSDSAVKRLHILCALVKRAYLETRWKMDKSEATISEATGVADWLKTRNLWDETDSREKQLFCAKPGNWPVMELLNASWTAEGCHVLAWALQIREDLLPWDTQAESYELFERLLSSKTSALPKFELRPEEEIRAKRELAELWLWRARTTLLQKNPEEYELDPSLDLNEVVKMAATKAAEEGWLDPIGEDFPAFGKSFRELNDDEYSTITSIAVERLRAFNWLCGYAENWKDVPTDT